MSRRLKRRPGKAASARSPGSISHNIRGAVGGGGGEGLGEKRKLFNLTKLNHREAQSTRDTTPKQPLRSQEIPKWIPSCNAIPAKRKTGRRRRRIEDLAETDCWVERLLIFFFKHSGGGGGGQFSWDTKA